MTVTASKDIKAVWTAFAVLLYGIAFYAFSLGASELVYIGLFVIAVVTTFFVVVVDEPTADLPSALQELQSDLETSTVENFITEATAYLNANEPELMQLLSTLDSEDFLALLKEIEANAPLLQELLGTVLTQIKSGQLIETLRKMK